MRRTSIAAVFATGLAISSGAALAEDPSAPLKIIEAKPTTQVVDVKMPEVVAAAVQDFSGGDLATYWVSPMLQNHDSRVSGVVYKVDDKPYFTKFGFSAVNPSAEAVEVTIRCHDRAGNQLAKYDAELKLAPKGGAMWSAEAIAPERSTDLLTKDADHVWCALTSPKPFAAFATMYVSDSATGRNGVTAINLVAAAR
jgi:hypothetical protein